MTVSKHGSENAKVSVCIPTYNAARFIRDTIKSVLDSTYSNVEVIVSDDASTDNTRAIVEKIDDSRIRFFPHDNNVGPVKNWNRAIRKASGDYAGLLNHDDLYGPFWLSFAVHTLNKHPHVGWVATANRIIDDKNQTIRVVSRFEETREYSCSEAVLCISKLDGLGPGFIARREILEAIGYYDENAGPGADNDLFLRLALKYPLYYSSYPHAAWRYHADNLTHQWGIINQVRESLRMLDKVFSDPELPGELRQHKKACYAYNYRKTLLWAIRLLNKGDLETTCQIIELLHTQGYQE